MPFSGRHAFRNISVIVLLAVVVAVWNYAEDLRTRFPDLDLSRSRVGIASWYSRTDKGINERTANNEIFDDRAMTCASWDYPFGEKLLVINAMNGKWVVCRVNDRGPALRLRRKIDLTKAAFKKIANPRRGLIYVSVIPVAKQREKRA
ncbi:MAG TPA: septal ring lytic transglycosylase RlpA family protein [Candidatus Omnitrophota bacterium]|jgi:rare lipoprotein A|nr:MAG: RlpA-like protein precursor [Candidatus Omnitrophica bacterium ADurb.Bin314]HOE68551.1 septal ring lytic transglycosylase RlpA family protein [Candidatus Omnitrophota bacterium]HPW65021.1 septal ring lytic transglycosylase RlpA family protein [Candidatus Omnitrophota bacterium]HQB93577.1 septal ring lytic transglycosylase RlpA family protein [Candidatus Omnitrophota bacterium]